MANGRRVGRTSVRRPTFWTGFQTSEIVLNAGGPASFLVVITEAALENVPNPTLIRSRGEWSASMTVSTDAAAVVVGAGLAVVDSRAATAGVASLPRPLLESDSDDWLWWGVMYLKNSVAGLTDIMPSRSKELDSKAMRKIGSNEVVVAVFEAFDPTATAIVTTQVQMSARILLKR